jgi:hypothetical protein
MKVISEFQQHLATQVIDYILVEGLEVTNDLSNAIRVLTCILTLSPRIAVLEDILVR